MELIGKRYELTKNLGSGSFGEAYLARDRRDDKAICLKLLRIVDSESIADIAGEFRLLSQLEHPNLIRVYDFGIDEKYGPYFTLEYAVNGNLGAILPLSPEKFISAVHSICAALDFVQTCQYLA
jgi:serine/threonine protein kinase